MSLTTGQVTLNTHGLGTSGFTFWVLLGAPADSASLPAMRSQGENNVFTRDYANAYFESGITYYFMAYHPQLMPDKLLTWGKFDTGGNWVDLGNANREKESTSPITPATVPNVVQVGGVSTDAQLKTFLFNELTLAKGDTVLTALLCSIVATCSGGTGGSTSTGLVKADIQKIIDLTLQAFDNRAGATQGENGPLIGPPVIPDQLGSVISSPTTVNAVINGNLSRYDQTVGLIELANCSNGENFQARTRGINGATSPDSTWHVMERFDGSFANGSYQYILGYLPAGQYQVDVRVGVDNTTIQTITLTVGATAPQPLSEFRISGNARPLESVQGGAYTVQQKYSDGSWKDIVYNGPWVLVPGAGQTTVPQGLGIAGGSLSGDPQGNIITVDTPFIIRVQVLSQNIDLACVLVNTQSGSGQPVTPTAKIINFVSTQVDANGNQASFANATAACEESTVIYQVINGVQQGSPALTLDWAAGAKIDGNYGANAGGATLQVTRARLPNSLSEGVFNFYQIWRPVGASDADQSQYARLPVYQLTKGVADPVTAWGYDPDYQDPPANTFVRIQYQFVVNGYGTAGQGSGDLLEFQSLDGYDEGVLSIEVRLASQSAGQGQGSYFLRDPNYFSNSNTTPLPKYKLRDYKLVSGQNLKSKTFKLDIKLTQGQTTTVLKSFTIVTGTTSTDGFITLYP